MTDKNSGTVVYRVWLVRCENWCPTCDSLPSDAIVVGEAEPGHMEKEAASDYVEQFNRTMSLCPTGIWAIAVSTVLRYDGDLEPGKTVAECAMTNRLKM